MTISMSRLMTSIEKKNYSQFRSENRNVVRNLPETAAGAIDDRSVTRALGGARSIQDALAGQPRAVLFHT